MRVLHIHSPGWPLGGAEAYLASLCRLQEERGYAITRLLVPAPAESNGLSARDMSAPRSWGILSGLRCLSALLRMAQQARPDIIHLHRTQHALSPVIVAALRRLAPTVLSLHDVGPLCYWSTKVVRPTAQLCGTPLGRGCFRSGCYALPADASTALHLYGIFLLHLQLRAYRGLEKILVANRYLVDELVKNGCAPERVTHLPLFTEMRAEAAPLPCVTDRHILYVGRLRQEKGIFQLIQALDLLRDEEWTAELVGAGPQARDAVHEATRRALEHKIRFVGEVPATALAPYYARCRVVAFPSMILENFGLVAIEAMTFGKPIVAFDCGGAREWLSHGETGFLVRLGDTRGFAMALQQLLRDPRLAMRMGLAGRQRVEQLFRAETHLARLEAIYRDVIREENP